MINSLRSLLFIAFFMYSSAFALCIDNSGARSCGVNAQPIPNTYVPYAAILGKFPMPSSMAIQNNTFRYNTRLYTLQQNNYTFKNLFFLSDFNIQFTLNTLAISLPNNKVFNITYDAGKYTAQNKTSTSLTGLLDQLSFTQNVQNAFSTATEKEAAEFAEAGIREISYNDKAGHFQFNISSDCGAGLIDSTHAITAAHCVTNKYNRTILVPPDNMVLSVGNHWQTGKLVQVTDIDVNPNYITFYTAPKTNDKEAHQFDFAILTLAEPVNLPAYFQLDSTASSSSDNTVSKNLVVAAFGTTSPNDLFNSSSAEPLTTLNAITQQPVKFSNCKDEFKNNNNNKLNWVFELDNPVLCAGGRSSDGSICKGDSGSPIFYVTDDQGKSIVDSAFNWQSNSHFYLVGVVSTAGQQCTYTLPDIYPSTYTLCKNGKLNVNCVKPISSQ